MRAKRSKQYRKLMQQYQLSFDFREPYQVIIDSGIIIAAARFKMQLGHLLQTNLHGQIKPMITQCSIRYLYQHQAATDHEKLEKEQWIQVAKSAERRRCGHHELEEPLTELECIMSCVDPKGNGSNKHKYVVATQEKGTREALRGVTGVPLIYINRSVMILEPMAARTEQARNSEEKAKIRAGLKTRRGAHTGVKRKREDDDGEGSALDEATLAPRAVGSVNTMSGAQEQSTHEKRRRKGPKGPNPLSVKKSTKPRLPAQHVDGERAATTRETGSDSKAPEKAVGGETGIGGDAERGQTKRKRKRKPKVDGVIDKASAVRGRDEPID